ncbi:Protein glycosylation K [Methylophilaceae bacterium]|nr:Protein glycosylation K [Methylophilaceae bacterium]
MNTAVMHHNRNVARFVLGFAGKTESTLLLSTVVLLSILDMIGIALVFPYIKIATNPSLLIDHSFGLLDWIKTMGMSQQIAVISVALILLYISKAIVQGLLIRFQQLRLAIFTARLTDDMVNNILSTRYGLFQEISGSELAGVAYSNTVHATIVFRSLIQMGNEIGFLLLMGLAFLVINPAATLTALLLLVLLATTIYFLVIRPTSLLGKEQSNIENERYRLLYAIVNAIRDIKVMGLAGLFDVKSREVSAQYAKVAWRFNFNSALTLLLVEVVAFIGLVVSVLVILSAGASVEELLPVIGVVAVAALRTVPAFAKLMASLNAYKFSRSFVEHLIYIRDRLESSRHARLEDGINFDKRIELRDIGFKYQEKTILHDINLEIERGQSIGIVGISGSGKTTLLDLITGLQPASAGDFYCDGQKFNPFTSRTMERFVGYVPQTLALLDESIAYNITFEHKPDIQQLMRVIKISNLNTLVDELPSGVDTKVGENGINLSGGQRQRIGIARALYRKPKIVVFDESTSALDAHTEQEVSAEIAKLRGEITMLIVSHRLPVVAECDRIYVITHGCIEDSGTHKELLGRCELYRDLYSLQTTFA